MEEVKNLKSENKSIKKMLEDLVMSAVPINEEKSGGCFFQTKSQLSWSLHPLYSALCAISADAKSESRVHFRL